MRTAAGFTLLEILVVLVLTSLVTGILLHGLQQAYRLQTHFGTETFHSGQGAMHADWFRNSINSIVPHYAEDKNRFMGETRRMSGQTTAALDALDGVPVAFIWRIEFDAGVGEMALYASEGRHARPVLTWSGTEGRFVYFDHDGSRRDAWPPSSGNSSQLPSSVLLEMGPPGRGRTIVAVPRGPDKPPLRQIDIMKN